MSNKPQTLAGHTIAVTGTIGNIGTRSEFNFLAQQYGAITSNVVNSKTSYLVTDNVNSTSKKIQQAKALNIPIISGDEFMQILLGKQTISFAFKPKAPTPKSPKISMRVKDKILSDAFKAMNTEVCI